MLKYTRKMSIKELIEQLQQYPEDMRVIIRGCDGGFNDVGMISEKTISLYYNEGPYYGRHENINYVNGSPETIEELRKNAVPALLIEA